MVSGRENIAQFRKGTLAALNVAWVRLETVFLDTAG